ncbi:hypothetical protein JL193_09165 [Polaribacter batillariae]|uniref:Addiction module antitoxin n=1 Tax=Polaribacter batillariae TaxID=2808900 RepID=A0ABX7SSP0_9FLAO|nr:hypothetical protein [Polaribacter batillariae]QTD36333.1 hypothetical protein JL193_09165 [Polaribacter batillariae]
MDLTTRKIKFKERFDTITDTNLVARFEEFLEIHLSNKKIVAYTVQGEPLTKEMYVEKIKKAEKSVKNGYFTTVEDLEKEVENW